MVLLLPSRRRNPGCCSPALLSQPTAHTDIPTLSSSPAASAAAAAPAGRMQRQHPQQQRHACSAAGQQDDVGSILQTLEASGSLLTSMFRDYVAGGGGQQQIEHEQLHPPAKRAWTAIMTELPLQVSLEELFSGTTKHVELERRADPRSPGGAKTVVQQLQVRVPPGLHAGTRITLPGLGNTDPDGTQEDLTFVLQQKQHPAFRRLANDLYAIVSVPLVTALTGGPVQLRALNGQLLQLPLAANTIITPNSELVLHNQGMPVFGDASGRRGALHVRFHVAFPRHLSRQQQMMLRQALVGAEDQQVQAGTAGAAAAVAAGLLPKPRAGLSLRPPLLSSSAAAQQQQEQHAQHEQQAVRGGWQQAGAAAAAACGGAVGSPGSTNSTGTAGAVAAASLGLAAAGGVSAFCLAAATKRGAACSVASSSSGSAVLPACMQSTGSSKTDFHLPSGRL